MTDQPIDRDTIAAVIAEMDDARRCWATRLRAALGADVLPPAEAVDTPGGPAIRWWRNGDHPGDHVGEMLDDLLNPGMRYARQEGAVVRFYRHPDVDGEEVHEACGRTWHDHGWIDEGEHGVTVCPGDIVVTNPDGTHSVRIDLSGPQRLLGEGAAMIRLAARSYKVPADVTEWAGRLMPVFSVKWADSCVNAVLDAVLTNGAATSGDISKTAKMAHDDVASILASMREAGWVAAADTDGPHGEAGGKWSLPQAGRQTYVRELQEHRERVLALEQCIADGLRRWDLTLDYLDPLGEALPDIEGWEHYEWRTAASAILAGEGVEPAPLRKRERDPAIHGERPVFVAEGITGPRPLMYTSFTVGESDGADEVKVTHLGSSPIWINGVSIYQPGDDSVMQPDDEPVGDPPPEVDGNHFSWDLADAEVGPSTWPDPNSRWLWGTEDATVGADRRVHRTLTVLGREVIAYASTRTSPGWFRDVILRRVRR